jgi:hypothetical protein
MDGAFYRAWQCEYDPETDMSTVSFVFVPPNELPNNAVRMQTMERAARMALKFREDVIKVCGPRRSRSDAYIPKEAIL